MNHDNYGITHKILEKQHENITIELFESSFFKKALLLNKQQYFLKQELEHEAQMLAYTAICSHPSPKKALVIGGKNPQIVQELLNHNNIQVYFYGGESWLSQILQKDLLDLDFTSYISNHQLECCCVSTEKLSCLKEIDIVVAYSFLSKEELSLLTKSLNPQAIVISKNHSFTQNFEQAKQEVYQLGKYFRIVMPFFIPYLNIQSPYFIFSSNAAHPLADLQLQKADMIEGLSYYSALIQQSAFVLPKWLSKALKGIAKN